MKAFVKQYLYSVIPSSLKAYLRDQIKRNLIAFKKGVFLSDFCRYYKSHRVIGESQSDFMDIANYQGNIIDEIHVDVSTYYIYPFDPTLVRIPKGKEIVSLTPDYGYVLEQSLLNVREKLSGDSSFDKGMTVLIDSIERLCDRIREALFVSRNPRKELLGQVFLDLLNRAPVSFDEALQKILFYNALLWQNRLWHNGLGRLDKILYPYYERDVSIGKLNREQAKEKLRHFVLMLRRDSDSKSYSLLGDTGQVVLLGGVDINGNNVANDLTEIFLELFAELRIPDPKLILRANLETPDKIWRLVSDCLLTGCGSPLLMNEELIISLMRNFGYAAEDCSELGTSACWEPLIIGKSFDQNNPLESIVLLEPLAEMLCGHYDSFKEFLDDYLVRLRQVILKRSVHISFDKSPIMSLLYESCLEKKQDITEGGAVYYYHGLQILGLPNAINSLLNIRTFVFDQKMLSLKDCSDLLKNNYKGMEDFRSLFLSNPLKFGCTDDRVVYLTKELSDCISSAISEVRINGTPVKVGFSSPGYIGKARSFPATLDGRKVGEPFATHISPVSQDIDLSEILRFASLMDYSGNRLNGNVVDFTVPDMLRSHPESLVALLKDSLKKGVYEIQLNVLDTECLKDARLHPERYPDLVVRVWGFSAYFNDLPDEYKDNLIRRAEAYVS